MKLLAGQLQPDAGKIIVGETVRIGYFSQELEEMDPDQRIIDYVRSIGEVIDTPGRAGERFADAAAILI